MSSKGKLQTDGYNPASTEVGRVEDSLYEKLKMAKEEEEEYLPLQRQSRLFEF